MFPLHEGDRESGFSRQDVGEGEVLIGVTKTNNLMTGSSLKIVLFCFFCKGEAQQELRESSGTDRREPDLLAAILAT